MQVSAELITFGVGLLGSIFGAGVAWGIHRKAGEVQEKRLDAIETTIGIEIQGIKTMIQGEIESLKNGALTNMDREIKESRSRAIEVENRTTDNIERVEASANAKHRECRGEVQATLLRIFTKLDDIGNSQTGMAADIGKIKGKLGMNGDR